VKGALVVLAIVAGGCAARSVVVNQIDPHPRPWARGAPSVLDLSTTPDRVDLDPEARPVSLRDLRAALQVAFGRASHPTTTGAAQQLVLEVTAIGLGELRAAEPTASSEVDPRYIVLVHGAPPPMKSPKVPASHHAQIAYRAALLDGGSVLRSTSGIAEGQRFGRIEVGAVEASLTDAIEVLFAQLQLQLFDQVARIEPAGRARRSTAR
jgi:hypothetical protein